MMSHDDDERRQCSYGVVLRIYDFLKNRLDDGEKVML